MPSNYTKPAHLEPDFLQKLNTHDDGSSTALINPESMETTARDHAQSTERRNRLLCGENGSEEVRDINPYKTQSSGTGGNTDGQYTSGNNHTAMPGRDRMYNHSSAATSMKYLSAFQLPMACYKLISQNASPRQQPPKPIGLSLFKSVNSGQNISRKRQYSEVSQTKPNVIRPIPQPAQIPGTNDTIKAKRQRFLRTAEALERSGLMKVTMQSAVLLKHNNNLQREIEELKKETQQFIQWVMSNPENQHLNGQSSS